MFLFSLHILHILHFVWNALVCFTRRNPQTLRGDY